MVAVDTSIDPSLLLRKIIHFDMDAFYASVEVRDDPSLAGKPLVVGGSPQSRGVVCTASYEARKFGIRSAMACARAARLCPQAIFIRPNFEKYQAVSQQIRAIFARYSDQIEPLSLDEAYLDVTHNAQKLYAVKIAQAIQNDIFTELKLTGSAGVAPNKLLAKIASDLKKPKGITVVTPDAVTAFMRSLPLRKIHGIGPATEQRLAAVGLSICSDVWPYSVEELTGKLGGTMASWLFHRARGIDHRPVEVRRERKSLGREETFSGDILDVEKLKEELRAISESVAKSLAKRRFKGRTITLKVRYADFERSTRSMSLSEPQDDAQTIFKVACELLTKTEAGARKIRLLGVSLSNISQAQ